MLMHVQPHESSHHVEQTCVTRKEAARRMGVPLAEVRFLESIGALLTRKIGRRRLVPISELLHQGVLS